MNCIIYKLLLRCFFIQFMNAFIIKNIIQFKRFLFYANELYDRGIKKTFGFISLLDHAFRSFFSNCIIQVFRSKDFHIYRNVEENYESKTKIPYNLKA